MWTFQSQTMNGSLRLCTRLVLEEFEVPPQSKSLNYSTALVAKNLSKIATEPISAHHSNQKAIVTTVTK